MKRILLFLLALFLLISFSKRSVELPPRKISIFPIVLNSDYPQPISQEERIVLEKTAKFLKENLNITLEIEDIFYGNYLILSDCDTGILKNLNVSKNVTDNYDVIIFFYRETMCRNVLGCAGLSGILHKPGRVFISLNGDLFQDVMVLVHELGHVFGAGHCEDTSIMYPAFSNVTDYIFGKQSKKEIQETLKESEERNRRQCLG